ncbi:hypothetical protein NDK43_22550 [Neobacillus pocheonensis]|uniref:Uncharacterized protein n=1 Tax=Neobacillus pocheonensis TaxID=363869 RepID=A0ABT0WE64_9BACI|nr:hypothetical protein [Neobacillus pocheonensis]
MKLKIWSVELEMRWIRVSVNRIRNRPLANRQIGQGKIGVLDKDQLAGRQRQLKPTKDESKRLLQKLVQTEPMNMTKQKCFLLKNLKKQKKVAVQFVLAFHTYNADKTQEYLENAKPIIQMLYIKK